MFDDSVHYHWISSGASCHIKPLNLIQRLFGLSTVWRAHGLVKDDDMCRWTVCHADKVCTSTTFPSIISHHIPSPSSIPTHHRQLCQCCGFMSQFLGKGGIPCNFFGTYYWLNWVTFLGRCNNQLLLAKWQIQPAMLEATINEVNMNHMNEGYTTSCAWC